MLLTEEKQRLEKEGKVAEKMYTPTGEYVLLKEIEKITNKGIKHYWKI